MMLYVREFDNNLCCYKCGKAFGVQITHANVREDEGWCYCFAHGTISDPESRVSGDYDRVKCAPTVLPAKRKKRSSIMSDAVREYQTQTHILNHILASNHTTFYDDASNEAENLTVYSTETPRIKEEPTYVNPPTITRRKRQALK